MARPTKAGLDYFPVDVLDDKKIQLLEIKHGLIGYAILMKLWKKIYINGYYVKWDEDEEMLFAKDSDTTPSMVSEVIDECLNRDLFSKDMFEKYGILTSKGVQERYFKIVKDSKRKNVKYKEEYLLANIDLDENFLEPKGKVIQLKNTSKPVVKETVKETVEKVVEKPKKEKEVRHKHGEYSHVLLTEKNFNNLVEEYGETTTNEYITKVDEYVQQKGATYKDYNLTIRKWMKNDGLTPKEIPEVQEGPRPRNTYDKIAELKQLRKEVAEQELREQAQKRGGY